MGNFLLILRRSNAHANIAFFEGLFSGNGSDIDVVSLVGLILPLSFFKLEKLDLRTGG